MGAATSQPSDRHRILILEDEEAIADALEFSFAGEGFSVRVVRDWAPALVDDVEEFDLVLLDLMLPSMPGYEVCRRIRERSVVPIIMLTARDSEADRVRGLAVGADDYVVKPFSMTELVGRVRAILRRREMDRQAGAGTVEAGDLRLDLVDRSVTIGRRRAELTPSEARLLGLLVSRPGQACTRRELVRHLWQTEHGADERVCDTHVKNLRRKLEIDPAHPKRLLTVRGVGYLLRPRQDG